MSAADRASAADLSCPGAVCLHCQFVPYGTWCAYVAHLSCPGAVCLHRRFVTSGTWCASDAHLSCSSALRLHRRFVMSGARCVSDAHLSCSDAVRLHRRFVTSWTRCTYVAHLSCLDAVRLHRQFVMSGTRCACAHRGWARCICANCMCPAHDSNSVMQSRAHTDRNLIGMARDLRMRAAPAQAAYISTAPQQNQARCRSRRRATPRNAADGAFARLFHAMPLSYGHATRRGSRAARHCGGTRRFEAVPVAWRVDCAFRRLRSCFTLWLRRRLGYVSSGAYHILRPSHAAQSGRLLKGGILQLSQGK